MSSVCIFMSTFFFRNAGSLPFFSENSFHFVTISFGDQFVSILLSFKKLSISRRAIAALPLYSCIAPADICEAFVIPLDHDSGSPSHSRVDFSVNPLLYSVSATNGSLYSLICTGLNPARAHFLFLAIVAHIRF